MPLKFYPKTILLYAAYAAAAVFTDLALPEAPLSLGLFFAMLLCGTNIIADAALYVLATAVCADFAYSMVALAAAVFLSAVTFLYRRSARRMRAEAVLYLIIALAPYVVFCKWTGFGAMSGMNTYALKAVAAAVTCVFCFFCFKTVYALLYRLYRCKLREDEYVCIAVVFTAAGAGFCAAAGSAAYLCVSAAGIALLTRLCRSPSSILAALILALPLALAERSAEPLTVYTVISAAALLFVNAGRCFPPFVCAALTAGYMYAEGIFECAVPLIVAYSLLLVTAAAVSSLPSARKLKEIKMRLVCEKVLDGTAIDRNRRQTGEKLYRISELFREIECAFTALDEGADEGAARQRLLSELREKCCSGCEKEEKCSKSTVYSGFKKMIDAGCIKGKVNLIDLPSDVTGNCSNPTFVMSQLNAMLAEYRRYMTECENASSGRKLLADQARGVAEVLKSCAVDLSRSSEPFAESAAAVKEALATAGVSCPEVLIDGAAGELSCVVCGKFNARSVCAVISGALRKPYVLKDKIAYDGQKTCLVFSSPPKLDAAFGVAFAVKDGESVSGDTHSVIRINEHSFLMALSDGMGSGVYARKVSEAAISLIEAFYRAEMPEDTVLRTINKLLSFNRDERFACIDIAAVNLATGRADFVKIGSPAGVIMREGELKILESSSLPLGILENLKPTVCTETIRSGDTIVFMSDGITSAFPSSTELYEFLQTLTPLNPQNLADKILAAAREKSGRAAPDDMTVICTRLFDNG